MAKDDYHVIVYQVLSYLYTQLKQGKSADPEKLSPSALFDINETYYAYILLNLLKEGFIEHVDIKWKEHIDGTGRYDVSGLEDCIITPKGIEYLTDNSFINKAKEFF